MAEQTSSYKSIFGASALASAVYVIVMNPFDVVKTTEQNLRTTVKSSAVLRNLVADAGYRSLWRGSRVSLAVTMLNNSIYWGAFETIRPSATQQFGSFGFFIAVISSRLISTASISPIERHKTRRQANITGPIALGLKGYRAFRTTVYRDIVFSTCYFGLMENIYLSLKKDDFTLVPRIVASVVGSFVAVVCSHPFDLMKTRMQTRYYRYGKWEGKPVIGMRHIWRTEGMKSIYAGFVPRICKLIPGAALYINCYEGFKGLLNSQVD